MSLISKELALKYGMRFAHMFSVISLSGKVMYDYLFASATDLANPSTAGQSAFYAIMGVVLVISGTVNMFILKPKDNMKENRGLWMRVLYVKFFASIFACTPLPKLFGFTREAHLSLQFYVILLSIIVSPALRFYREYFTDLHKSKKLNNYDTITGK